MLLGATTTTTSSPILLETPGGWFMLKNKAAGTCLNVVGGSSLIGTPVNQFGCDLNNPANLWRWEGYGAERQLRNKMASTCLSAAGGNTAIDTTTFQAACYGLNAANLWTVEEGQGEWKRLRNQLASTCVNVVGGNTALGAATRQNPCGTPNGSDLWQEVSMPEWFLLRNQQARTCLSVVGGNRAPGTLAQQFSCDASNGASLWRWEGSGGTKQLVNKIAGTCLSVENGSTATGATVSQVRCAGSNAAALWSLESGRGLFVQIRNQAAGTCLNVKGGSTAPGAKTQQNDCGAQNGANLWQPISVAPPAPPSAQANAQAAGPATAASAPPAVVAAASAATASSANSSFNLCQIPSSQRGAGTPLSTCGSGEEQDGLLCYPRCNAGERGVGPLCWTTCPSGFRDDGAFCTRDADIIGRTYQPCPDGYITEPATCRRDTHIFGKTVGGCASGYRTDPLTCWRDVDTYAKNMCVGSCASGYTDWGCFCTRPADSYARSLSACPAGYQDDGLTCRRDVVVIGRPLSSCPAGYITDPLTCRRDVQTVAKTSRGRGWGTPMHCAAGEEQSGALCYPPCPAGTTGVGPTCFQPCDFGDLLSRAWCSLPDMRMSWRNRESCTKFRIGTIGWNLQPDDVLGQTLHALSTAFAEPAPSDASSEDVMLPTSSVVAGTSVDLKGQFCRDGKGWDGGLCYKQCKAGYTGIGPYCYNTLPFWHDKDNKATAASFDRGIAPLYAKENDSERLYCGQGMDLVGWLCHPSCGKDYTGNNSVCWNNASPKVSIKSEGRDGGVVPQTCTTKSFRRDVSELAEQARPNVSMGKFSMIISSDPQFAWFDNAPGTADSEKRFCPDNPGGIGREMCVRRHGIRTNREQIFAMGKINTSGYLSEWPDTPGMPSDRTIGAIKGLIINGDLTESFHPWQFDLLMEHYGSKKYFDHVGLDVPVFLGLGNHDYHNNWVNYPCGEARFGCAREAVKFMEAVINCDAMATFKGADWVEAFDRKSLFYSWNVGKYHFVQLHLGRKIPYWNSDWGTTHNGLTKAEYDKMSTLVEPDWTWLATDLTIAKGRGQVTVLNAHSINDGAYLNFFDPGFQAAIADKNVVAFFAGHDHPELGRYGKGTYTIPRSNPTSTENGKIEIPVFLSGGAEFQTFLLVDFRPKQFIVGGISSCGRNATNCEPNGPKPGIPAIINSEGVPLP